MVLFATRAIAATTRPAGTVVLKAQTTPSLARWYANMTTRGIPIVLMGRTAEVGSTVSEALKPEYEVIHFLSSAETASFELPRLFAGQKPGQSSFANIGTQDYSRRPQAVVLGGAFTNTMVDTLRKDCANTVNAPWMTAGMTEQQLEKLERSPPDPATYGPFVAKLIKGAMARVKEEGKWDADGVYSYR